MKLLIATLTVLVVAAHAQFLELRARPARPADLALVFHRPAEPVFSPRGVHRREAFDVPDSYLPERYRRVASKIRADRWRSGVQLIEVRELPMPMDRFADVHTTVPFRSLYTRGDSKLSCTVRFWHFFDESETFEELLAKAVWAKLNFQPDMILEALVMTILRSKRPEVKAIPLPEQTQYLPEFFINQDFYGPAREEMHSVSNDVDRVAIPVMRNEAEDEESKVWYFRTDVHFNQMHWRWHYFNPSSSDDVAYADLPRRGESFVYLHKTFVSRYNAERFSVGLPAVLPIDLRAIQPSGYFPKLFRLHASRGLPGRQDSSSYRVIDAETHEKSMERYREVLRTGVVRSANGTVAKVEELPGLDVVSNLLEGNVLFSPDFDFYGNIHNSLHTSAMRAADLSGKHKETSSVEAFFPVSINDPVFFNVHMFMENTYEEYRTKYLTPYSKEQLTPLPNVVLQSVVAQTEGLQKSGDLRTFWQESDLDVSLGLDFVAPGRLYARFTHLQHRRFNYKLQIANNNPVPKQVFVRLYLLMTVDESGLPLDASFQRQFAMQMDIFSTTLRPGSNEVLRRSTDSAFTTDWDEIYIAQKGDMPPERTSTVNLCRNGWPQNLMLPRGNPTGVPYKLFAMVTDYDEDKAPDSAAEKCPRGWVLSGVHGVTNYPDRRAMGFPFDRPYRKDVASLQDLLTDNMAISDVVVTFENLTEPPTPLLPGGASTSWLPPTNNQA